ncbi:MAG: hypothetical protein ABR529_03835 [Actinomycetota bacterium]
MPQPDVVRDGSPDGVRYQAQALGGATFARTEGCWAADDRIYFACTTGGVAEAG